ncbi:MAG: thioredoxin domain-containing protein [Imperialibacter sp.]|uniref:thioredoxin family protein n=1 Tax=Imperialibacter sp. TaxID=2038411 RepID=UPI0032F0676F
MKQLIGLLSVAILAIVATAATPAEPTATEWTSIDQLAEKLKKEPRPVIVEMYANWCGWCKKMDKTTFTDPEVVSLLNESVYVVKINGETTDKFTFLGKETSGREMVKALGIQGYPTFILVDNDQDRLEIVSGYKTSPQLKRIITKLARK